MAADPSCVCESSSNEPLSDTDIERRVDQIKALAHPVRLKMVDVIYDRGGEICVCEFMEVFDLSQPTISHHLKVLRDAGLITSRREGTFVHHRVVPAAFDRLAVLMDRFSTIRERIPA